MTTGPDNAYQLAAALLASCQRIYAANRVTPPSLAYVYGPGEPPGLCDQLVVSFGRIYHGMAAGADTPMLANHVMPRSADLVVWVFRCLTDVLQGQGLELTDVSVDPSRAAYDAQQIMTDAYILHRGIVAAHFAGTFKDFSSGLAVGDAIPIQSDGGVGGVRIAITSELS